MQKHDSKTAFGMDGRNKNYHASKYRLAFVTKAWLENGKHIGCGSEKR